MAKRKSLVPISENPKGVRYIARVTFTQHKAVKHDTVFHRRSKGTYTSIVRSGEAQILRKARVLKSPNEVRAFAALMHRKFKGQKKYENFNINVQAFSGQVGRSKAKLYLKQDQQSSQAARSRNISKRAKKGSAEAEINRTINEATYAGKHEDFSDTTRRERKPPRFLKSSKIGEKAARNILERHAQKSPLVAAALDMRNQQKANREHATHAHLRGDRSTGKMQKRTNKRR